MKYTFIPSTVETLTDAEVQVMTRLNIGVVGVEGKLDKQSTRDIVTMCGVSGYVHGSKQSLEHYVKVSVYVPWHTIQNLAKETTELEGFNNNVDAVQSAFNGVRLKLSIVRPGLHTKPSYVHDGTLDDVIRMVPDSQKAPILETARWCLQHSPTYQTGAYQLRSGEKHLWVLRAD